MYSLRLLMMDRETVRKTCRVLFQNKINLRYCASGWFYYRNILQYMVLKIINQIHSNWNSKFKSLLSLSSQYYVPYVNSASFNAALNNADKFYQSKNLITAALTCIYVVLVYSWWDLQQPDSWVYYRIHAAFLDCLTLQMKYFETSGTIRPAAHHQISEDLNMW
jgi:hypothetical protein